MRGITGIAALIVCCLLCARAGGESWTRLGMAGTEITLLKNEGRTGAGLYLSIGTIGHGIYRGILKPGIDKADSIDIAAATDSGLYLGVIFPGSLKPKWRKAGSLDLPVYCAVFDTLTGGSSNAIIAGTSRGVYRCMLDATGVGAGQGAAPEKGVSRAQLLKGADYSMLGRRLKTETGNPGVIVRCFPGGWTGLQVTACPGRVGGCARAFPIEP